MIRVETGIVLRPCSTHGWWSFFVVRLMAWFKFVDVHHTMARAFVAAELVGDRTVLLRHLKWLLV